MAVASKSTMDFHRLYEGLQKGKQPQWLSDLRRAGMDGFQRLGFPTRKNEEYKYTDCTPIQSHDFVCADRPSEVTLSALDWIVPKDATRFVFVDGFFAPQHSRFDASSGFEFQPVSDIVLEDQIEVQALITSPEGQSIEDPFLGLNQALFQDGVVLRVKSGAHMAQEIHVITLFSGVEPNVMAFPRHTIQVGESANVSIVQTSICARPQGCYWNNAQTDFVIEANAHVRYTQIQDDCLSAYHIHNTRMKVAQDSQVSLFTLTTGGRLVRNNLSLSLEGSGIDIMLNGLYTVRGRQHVDNHTSVDHRYPHSVSSQLYKGILSDKGRTVFNGKIFVQPEAQKTNAYQLNRNVLLSPVAEADTKPQLEIFADDVRCTHGATIGPLSEMELFYLQSRGVSREQAISLLSHGFADEALSTVKDEDLQNRLRAVLAGYFDAIEGKTT